MSNKAALPVLISAFPLVSMEVTSSPMILVLSFFFRCETLECFPVIKRWSVWVFEVKAAPPDPRFISVVPEDWTATLPQLSPFFFLW